MSRGLSFVLDIIHSTAPEKQSILQEDQIQGCVFLTEYLKAEPYDHANHTARYNDWVNKTFLLFISDNDGPNLAWTWANNSKVRIYYFEDAAKRLREWAYVMWDKERVKKWRSPK
jgi:hypothetical protein